MKSSTILVAAVGAVIAASSLAGCASVGGAPAASPSNAASRSPSVEAAAALDPDTTLDCMGVEVTARALAERTPASQLPDEFVTMLETSANSPVHDLDGWFVVVSGDDHVVLMREEDPPIDLGAGDVRDFALFSASKPPGAMPLDDEWGVDSATNCTPRIDLGGLTEANLTLDADDLPEPGDREIALLATEFACNSGEPATGRVEVVDVVETETTVELVVGVAPNTDGAAHTCQGNPPTPFTVELDRELGDRTILDVSVVPAHEIVEPALATG